MEDVLVGEPAASAVAALASAVDELLALPLDLLPAPSVTRLICDLEVQRNRLAAVDQAVLAAATSSGAVTGSASTSVAGLLMSLTRCSRGQARARASRAVDLGPRRSLAGEPLAPIHPRTAAAVADGAISEAHCQVIVGALGRIRPDAEPSIFDIAEAFLVEAAKNEGPRELALSADTLLAHLDPDGVEPAEDTLERARSFGLCDARDGTGGVLASGRLTAEAAAVLRTVLDALAAPRPTTVDGVEVRDERSGGQRYHDALLELAVRALNSGDLPDSGGTPTSLIVSLPSAARDAGEDGLAASCPSCAAGPTGDERVRAGQHRAEYPMAGQPEAEVSEGGQREAGQPEAEQSDSRQQNRLVTRFAGVAQLGGGSLVRLERLYPLLDQCEVTTVTLTASGGIHDYGRERRLATPAMRRALTARDGGCCFPGCDRPASWTQAHHIVAWLDGGTTSLDNLCLLCAHHHRVFAPAGWQVVMRDDLPTWIPPAWLDPLRRPVVNTTRHLVRISFDVPLPVP